MTEQRPYLKTYTEPRITEKLRIYKEVLKGENKDHEVLDAKAIKEANKKWKVNFPIGIEERELGDTDFQAANKRMCFKWQGYERGTWELASEFASNEGMVEEYQLRLFRLDTDPVFRSGTIARVDVAMKHTLEVRQDAAEEQRPDEPRVSHRPRTLQVTTSATPSCPTRDLWTRCSWMRNLARRLPSVRPEEAAEEACEEIEHFIKEIFGGGDKGSKAFKKAYPNRYLKWEKGEGHYGYVTKKRTLYITRLRAIEDHFNFVNEKFGLPRVYIEDWTDNEEELDKALSELFYTQASRFTNEVLEIMKDRSRNLDAICCGPQCSTRKKPCTYNTGAPCCVMDKRMSLDNKDVPHFINQGQKRGRQHVLVIFRDVKKEWTLRCVSEFKSKEFVMEYVGRCPEIRLGSSTGRAQQYDFDLGYDAPGHEESLKIAGPAMEAIINRRQYEAT
ncbi:hypothetical protein PRIPAC_77894 [Pristionchus pacificus]|uniref:Uncharacterized protein n=1 Tax=Pristionchus pacificus TaxID=54126 RepID=A0A2A6CIZ6_PRIPA|nr:hypothetical protein PRIPAC_77894 [Pristionchus pacificus]|eukprot:PDM78204.1 hypothetical protein PRIPAC_30783 [Pristionchus pacificus]